MIRLMRGRILVKVVAAKDDLPNKLNLALVDKAKHYQGSRRGVVEAIGEGVRNVNVGDEVVFRGDSGFTLDYDPESHINMSEERWRWLKEPDCLAKVERTPEPEPNVLAEARQ